MLTIQPNVLTHVHHTLMPTLLYDTNIHNINNLVTCIHIPFIIHHTRIHAHTNTEPYFFRRRFRNAYSDPKFGWRGVVLATPMPGHKVMERRSNLRSYEKERPKRRSGAKIPLHTYIRAHKCTHTYFLFPWIEKLDDHKIRKTHFLYGFK
jgi:hypothetical protein